MKRVLMVAIAAVLSVGPAVAADSPNPLLEAAPFIDKANADWGRAIIAGDVNAIVAPYAEDGVFILPDGKAIEGKPAIRQMYSARPKRAQILDASATSDGRVAAGPDDVYEWGTATATVKTETGIEKHSLGRFLTVWHRQGTSWVISRNLAF
jgi:ketosteroid isomerase-like protein